MRTALLGSLSLCASCGRDRDGGAERCACDALPEPWRLVGSAPPGVAIDTRLGSLFFGGLALGIVLTIASANAIAVLCMLLLAPVVVIVVFFGGREWRTESGAVATTFGGVLVAAEGRGVVTLDVPIVGYPRLRGDHTAASLADGGRSMSALGSNPVEVAVVAALLGAASRGSIRLRARDAVRWKRSGRTRSFPERTPDLSAILVEPTENIAGEEDKLLHDLLAGGPLGSGIGSYRDIADERKGKEPASALLFDLFAALPSHTDGAAFSAHYADDAVPQAIRDAQLVELGRASADVTLREPVRVLLHDLRQGAQSRMARVRARLG